MAKSYMMWAAALMVGATSVLSPAQAATFSSETPLEKFEETQTLVAGRGRGNRYCWRRYGRVRCKGRRDRFDNRWRDRRWRDRRWRRRDGRWRDGRWRDGRWRDGQWRDGRWRDGRWRDRRHRNDDWRWRRGDKRGDFRDKLDRWLNRRVYDD
ncbi:hypothetical protein [Acaryochloris marina]|uniref:hypothetical protein n=1 Tax=Acaryochloris marina TaxID=155978 RepID=UPI0008FFB375|nr:hypothetical protein [Acaryochloris marina]